MVRMAVEWGWSSAYGVWAQNRDIFGAFLCVEGGGLGALEAGDFRRI